MVFRSMAGCRYSLICLIIIVSIVYGRSQTAGRHVCGTKVPCDNSECIERGRWCDRRADCRDASDEMYCATAGFWSTPDNGCNSDKHFVCNNAKCVPRVVKCDRIDDCGDNSDEFNCEVESTTDSATEDVSWKFDRNDRGIGEASLTKSSNTYNHGREIPSSYNRNGQYHQNYRSSRGYSDTGPADNFPSNVRTTDLRFSTNPRASPSSRNEYYPSGTFRDFHHRQQWPEIHHPRSVSYSRTQYSGRTPIESEPISKKHRKPVLPPFYFVKNYTQYFGSSYRNNVKRAEQWLLARRDDHSYGWGKDTPRALVALSLITNSFSPNIADNDLMKQSLKTHLGAKLLRNNMDTLSSIRLAMYINALLATCQDPRQFFDHDLVDILYRKRNILNLHETSVNPLVYITLCLTNSSVTRQDVQLLEDLLIPRFPDEVSKDRSILATTALACFQQWDVYRRMLNRKVNEAFNSLLAQRRPDGSFGSIYSTAIAAQALLSINATSSWNPELTLDYLSQHQSDDGSFGNMLATYYILPVLSGRSLLHLRNTQCEQPVFDDTPSPQDILDRPGPKKSILYSLAVGYRQRFSIALHMNVHVETNFFDIMKVAQYLDPRFRFLHKEVNGFIDVYTIANVPNDPERAMYWNLYVLNSSNTTVDTSDIYAGDIRTLIPEDTEELLYWYLPTI